MKVSKQVKSFINGVVQGALQGNMTCPITHELFEDPVFCSGDGQTYERSAIEEWLKTKTTSPFTHKELSGTELPPVASVDPRFDSDAHSAARGRVRDSRLDARDVAVRRASSPPWTPRPRPRPRPSPAREPVPGGRAAPE